MQLEYAPGATPLDPDELLGLIPRQVTTQGELNEWEQLNILEAQKWAFSKKVTHVLEMNYCRLLHKKMFDKTWKWAGTFRTSNKNIGIFWEQVPMQLKLLLDDAQYQQVNKTYSLDEIATRLHHRLAWTHPFPNGNGRHARLMADVFLFNHSEKRFTWGRKNLISYSKTRSEYIASLRKADKGDYTDLLRFVRS